MIDLILLADPAPAAPPEPAANYAEIIGIPLLVAVVTAVVTSWLGAKREHSGRLATLRLETYSEVIRLAERWQVHWGELEISLKKGDVPQTTDTKLYGTTYELYDQLSILRILSTPENFQKILDAYNGVLDSLPDEVEGGVDTHPETYEAVQKALQDFVRTVASVGRKEVRSTRV